MRLPAPLLRRNPHAHKNQFGHVLIIAGSPRMLGAAALCGLAAMRSGAGLTTIGVAKSLNLALHKKISNVIMTLPLLETPQHVIALKAYAQIKKSYSNVQAIAVGPGLGREPSTKQFVLKLIRECPLPLVIDADALNILASDLTALAKACGPRILTPHSGEMARLTGQSREAIEGDRKNSAKIFANKYNCVLLLKGHRTVVASPSGKIYINRTGNAGMATAGSGDVLTGMMTALLAQGLTPFESARVGCYLHGKAGDWVGKHQLRSSMIATDIIDAISTTMRTKTS